MFNIHITNIWLETTVSMRTYFGFDLTTMHNIVIASSYSCVSTEKNPIPFQVRTAVKHKYKLYILKGQFYSVMFQLGRNYCC